MKKLSVNTIVSRILLLLILFLAASGAMLYFGKTGVILGLSRSALREAHFYMAIFMCALSVVHLFLNRRKG